MVPSSRRNKRAPSEPPDLSVLIGKAISSLTPQARLDGAFLIRVKGKRAGSISQADAHGLALAAGVILTEDLAERIRMAESRLLCRTAALRLLSRAAQTSTGLAHKLKRKRFGAADITPVIENLLARGLINDELYAQNFAASRTAAGRMGPRLLRTKLMQRGVPEAIINATLAELKPRRDQLTDALALLKRTLSRAMTSRRVLEPSVQRRRLTALLARRGFDLPICFEAVRQATKGA